MELDNKIKVSIVVPVYNAGKYLSKCIESICNQTYENTEVILVDDGSTDDSGKICDRYIKDRRVKVIHKKNGGQISARKMGVKDSTGDYITFVDADDWIEEDYIEGMVESLYDDMMADMGIALSYRKEFEDGSYIDIKPEKGCLLEERIYKKDEFRQSIWKYYLDISDIRRHDIPVSVWLKIFRSEFIKANYDYVDDDVTRSEDDLTNFILFVKAKSVGIRYKSGYHYVKHPDSSSTMRNNEVEHVRSYRRAQENAFSFIDVQKIPLDEKEEYKERYLIDTYYGLMIGAGGFLSGLSNKYLFPYPQIINGSRIMIYALGSYGKALCDYIEKSKRFSLTGASDRMVRHTYTSNKLVRGTAIKVYSPKDFIAIPSYTYDYIIITLSRKYLVEEVEDWMISNGIEKNKIAHMDNNLLRKDPFKNNLSLMISDN